MKPLNILRQGDVLLVPVTKLPADCTEVSLEKGRIVLMHGEVTGHAHAIEDHTDTVDADAIISDALKLSARRARLLQAPNGARYLEVTRPVSLVHEEHTAHQIPVGLYEIPVQVEHTAERVRRVAD